ncbi:hypothetical protein [Paraburkholderia silvatlantica]|uniref:hypothetical protein n=1 Tax=Paraburkholderia silvatlantica TaxID=321895 RepID=UPI0037533537
MTICAAWIRRVGKTEELVFCTDSRLRKYGSWDANPKIFTFERSDCAICFSGDTLFSYPLMIQLKNSIDANPKMETRFQRLEVFKEILVKTLNRLMAYKSDYEIPDVNFLFGGFCWFRQHFKIWQIEYSDSDKKFFARQLTNGIWKKGDLPVFLIGDYLDSAKHQLISLLKTRTSFTERNYIDMEPLEVISAMLRSPHLERDTNCIGGPPQMLKVYKSLNRVPFGVTWSVKGAQQTTLFGMPVHSLSGFPYPIIDPLTLVITNSNSYR